MTCSYFWLKVWESLGEMHHENNETVGHPGHLPRLSLVLGAVVVDPVVVGCAMGRNNAELALEPSLVNSKAPNFPQPSNVGFPESL